MGVVPATRERSATEAVARLRRKLDEYFEVASARPRNLFSLVQYFVHVRHQLGDAVQHLRNEDVHERLLRQAEIAFLTRPHRFAEVNGRSDLIRAWTTLLVEANEKLEADERKTAQYAAAVAADPENEGPTAVSAASRAALQRWQDS